VTSQGPIGRGASARGAFSGAALALVLAAGSAAAFAQSAPGNPAASSSGTAAPEAGTPAAGPPIAGDAAPAAESAKHPETYLEFAIAGGPLMVPIGILSVLLVAFLIERVVSTRRALVLPRPFAQGIAAMAAQRSVDRALAANLCAAHPSSAARILGAAVERLERPRPDVEHAVNTVAQREVFVLRRYTRLFAIIASVAPLLGLLGTVTGMVQAFREVAIQGLGSGQALAPGIYQALITTVAGLLVAIPALIVYHWLNARIENYVHAIDRLVVDLVDASQSSPAAGGGR
jgi:biopolymer transport protein ExbB